MWYLLSQRKRGFFHREKKEFRANVIRYYQGGNAVFFAEEGKEDAYGMGNNVVVGSGLGYAGVWPPDVVFVITEEGRWFSQREEGI
jgi:predicted cupin superfamily sugar epimerase